MARDLQGEMVPLLPAVWERWVCHFCATPSKFVVLCAYRGLLALTQGKNSAATSLPLGWSAADVPLYRC
jgi:hypothetical protein